MFFLTEKQVIELFKNFDIIEFKEVEKDDFTGLGKNEALAYIQCDS